MTSFGRYSDYYDLLYRDKNYGDEVAFVEGVFQRFAPESVRTVLDGGCGTGGHAFLLAKQGYKVTGVDSSEQMLAVARRKLGTTDSVEFLKANLTDFSLGRRFDACLCMFAVMGYITGTEELLAALRSIRAHLLPGGLFCFDFWNGLAVMRQLPSERVKTVEAGDLKVVRYARPELDAANHLCLVHYDLLALRGDRVEASVRETHEMRFFFPQEIAHYVKETGFEVLRVCPFLNLEGILGESTWNGAVVAKVR